MTTSSHFKAVQDFVASVPRGTLEALNKYVELVLKWNKTINLVAKSTENDIWTRHVLDSAQLIQHIPKTATVFDIGSGQGFPGIVIALVQGNKVILVEKDGRKCAFLHHAKAATSANIEIKHAAVEETNFTDADVIICRAFAPLIKTLNLTRKLIAPRTKLVLLKGARYQQEAEEARASGWSFKHTTVPSLTNKDAAILIIKEAIYKSE